MKPKEWLFLTEFPSQCSFRATAPAQLQSSEPTLHVEFLYQAWDFTFGKVFLPLPDLKSTPPVSEGMDHTSAKEQTRISSLAAEQARPSFPISIKTRKSPSRRLPKSRYRWALSHNPELLGCSGIWEVFPKAPGF